MKTEPTSVCGACGASVYQEHIDSGIARHEDGKLLCSFCVADYERQRDALETPEASGSTESIALEVEEEELEKDRPKSRIQLSQGSMLGATGLWDDSRFKRRLQPGIAGATRCRTFHAKLSEGALDFMTNQINEWLDNNDEVAIKFVSSSIGMFEGKHTEPNLILTMFY